MAIPHSLSYTEYLGAILPQWPEFRDLYQFLSTSALSGPENGKALIIDQEHDGRINARRFTNNTLQLHSALSRRLPVIGTRIVILQYTEAKNLSRELVDIVATRYHISPILLCSHFLDGESSTSSYRQLCSQVPAFEFGFYRFLHASILFLPSDDLDESAESTILVLLRTSNTGCKSPTFELESLSRRDDSGLSNRVSFSADISERYIACLRRSASTGQAARTPVELIHPLCQLIALEIKHHFHTSSRGWEEDRVISLLHVPEAATELKALDYDFAANLYRISMDMDITALRETIAAITHLGACSLPSQMALELRDTVIWQRLRQDLECLLEETVRNKDKFEAYEARCLGRFSLTAATESLEQSRSVGHLTMLAFIFIPLSFMTSFFGMNIAEFGTGDVHFRIFILSTIAVLITVILVWLLSGWIGRHITAISSNFYGLRIRLQTLRALAVISPTAAFWLVCFAISHPPRMFQSYLLDIGVWGVIGLGMDWDPPGFDREENLRQWQMSISPFWQRRGMEILEITRVRGWQKKSWYRRWRERR